MKALIVITLLLIAYLVIYFRRRQAVSKAGKATQLLKDSCTSRLTIKAADCEVKNTESWEEVEDMPNTNIRVIDGLGGKSHTHQTQVMRSVIVYGHLFPQHGKATFVSPTLRIDKQSLLLHLMAQQTINVYYNPHDHQQYYFDLAFLDR
ncbi:hypothetical protein [Chitinophaga nivalis]|uniref:Uncharacterized protein n=1 Tax=Chitinophaga nivalis TaxID=2991709 RepID=A0ABT3ITE5_9BACT|nr:hypothetical protein [Chitinophaga nivalis]MCW3463058.1 hypothetical protein [Chitinophaga nivalis]MCW3487252.1 hypothetical protein [Chitinophaga nivalis]